MDGSVADMAHYRKIDTRIWNDEKFRSLSDDGQMCFFFQLTHPHMTAIGAMRATLPGLASEKGWLPGRFAEAFREASAKGMTKHDAKASVVWVPKFIRYNPPESPNVLKAWASAVELLPECDLTRQAIQAVKDYAQGLTPAFREALPKAFREGCPQPSLNQEQEQEQERTPLSEPRAPVAVVYGEAFMRFWAAWPKSKRKSGKFECWQAWRKLRLDALVEDVVAHVEAMKFSQQWRDGYDPAPTTYLRNRRWEDEVPAVSCSSNGVAL